jgi:hypothetical protein
MSTSQPAREKGEKKKARARARARERETLKLRKEKRDGTYKNKRDQHERGHTRRHSYKNTPLVFSFN